MTMTLSELSTRTGLDVLDHLEREVAVPVVDGLQAQGDLIVVPFALVADSVRLPAYTQWQDVPPAGLELLRSAAGGNPHTLVADRGTCHWTQHVFDDTRLALAVIDASAVAYLVHPEHGATGIAPGRYVARRQRERGGQRGQRLIAD